MKKSILTTAIFAAFALNTNMASAELKIPKTKVSFEKALKVALAIQAGEVETAEMEISDGKPQYEFDIRAADGSEHEIEVSALTGKVLEQEVEVENANVPAFKVKAIISEAEAEKTALAAFPGTVHEKEYAIESNGSPVYEFDIKTADGKEIEVEVDAMTGKLAEHEEEVYQIGKE